MRIVLHTVLLSCGALLGSTAIAQTSEPTTAPAGTYGADDIIVTARRREERLLDVPMAIVSASQQSLTEKNVKTTNDLILIAPGLSIQNSSANRNDTTYSIRGQGQVLGQDSPGVVAYFAEVPGFSNSLFDLESVQVLKGPQGTLFGKNTTGGAILFSPHKATEEFNGYLTARIGDYGRQDAEFGIGGSVLGGKLLFRVAGQSLNRNGIATNLFDGRRVDNENSQNWRATLTVRPFDALESTTIYVNDHTSEAGASPVLAVLVPNPSTQLIFGQLQNALAAQNARGPRVIDANWPLYNRYDNEGFLNRTTLSIGDHFVLKNIVSERKFRSGQSFDSDGTGIPIFEVTNSEGSKATRTRVWTEEIQAQAKLGALNLVVGYYKDHQHQPLKEAVDLEEVFNGFQIRAVIFGENTLASNAVFGQADLRIGDKLNVTAGIRQNHDDRESFVQTFVLYPGQPAPTGTTADAGPAQTGSFKATTWNVAADYAIDQDLHAYGTVRRGYKSGGFNGTAILPQDRLFQPEFVTDYEAGIKAEGQWGAVRGLLTIDGFYDKYTNIQRNITLTTIPASTITRNAASGNIYGVDVDFDVRPIPWFDLSIVYTYMHAKYTKYQDERDGDLSASKFPNTPTNQFTITPRFTIPTPDQVGKVTFLANIYHQSRIATDTANVPNGTPTVALSALDAFAPGYTRVDLRADWQGIFGTRLSGALYARNVLNKNYVTGTANALVSFGLGTRLYGLPRMYGAELTFAF